MIKSVLYFSFALYSAVVIVYGNTCTCTEYPFGGSNLCIADPSQNQCTGENQICPCSTNSISDCPGINQIVSCVTANFDAPSANTCTCTYALGECFGAINGCSQTEACSCDRRNTTECASLGTGTCVPVGAFGDPHFLGFDNRRFDFHGVHGKSYLVYAEETGDIFSAKVRSTPELYNGYNKTYFNEFGLQAFGSSEKIHFFLAQVAERTWRMQVTVNYKRVSSNLKLKTSTLLFNNGGSSVKIVTAKNMFRVKGISLRSKFRRHLDFKLKKGPIVKSDRYSGVLGMTLSRRLGSSIHQDVIGKGYEKQFEMKMRKHYGLKTMFPPRSLISEQF